MDNITYKNRTLDEGDLNIEQPWTSSQSDLEIDLTEFLKEKKKENATTACIHVTTTTVENCIGNQ